MEEPLHTPVHAYGVRGNVFSFLLPWENVMSKLSKAFAEGDLTEWPLDQATACQVVRVQLIRGHANLLDQFKELKVRSQVVKELANIYIDRQCDDLLQSYKAMKLKLSSSKKGPAREILRHHIEV